MPYSIHVHSTFLKQMSHQAILVVLGFIPIPMNRFTRIVLLVGYIRQLSYSDQRIRKVFNQTRIERNFLSILREPHEIYTPLIVKEWHNYPSPNQAIYYISVNGL